MTSEPDDLYPPYDELEIDDAPSVDALLQEALLRFDAGDIEGAVQAWQYALAKDPNNAVAIEHLSSAGFPPSPSRPGMAGPFSESEPPRFAVHRRSGKVPVIAGMINRGDEPTIVVAPVALASPRSWLPVITGVLVLALLAAILVVTLGGGSDRVAKEAVSTPPPDEPPPVSAVSVSPPAPASFEVEVSAEPPTAAIYIDDAEIGTGAVILSLPRDGKAHALRVEAPGFATYEAKFIDVSPRKRIVLEAMSSPDDARPAREAISPPDDARPRARRMRARAKPTEPAAAAAAPAGAVAETAAALPSSPSPDVTTPTPGDEANKTSVEAAPPTLQTDNKDPWAE